MKTKQTYACVCVFCTFGVLPVRRNAAAEGWYPDEGGRGGQ